MWLIRSSFFFFLKLLPKKKGKRNKKCHVTKIRFLHQIIECLFWLIWANTIMINVCIYQKNGKVETWLSSQSKKKKKIDNVWLSILKTFCAVVISKGQLVVPDTVFYFQNHRSLRQLQSKSWRDNIRLQFFFFDWNLRLKFFFLISVNSITSNFMRDRFFIFS